MAADAASGWVLDEVEEGNLVPKASKVEEIQPKEVGQVKLVFLDIEAYAER